MYTFPELFEESVEEVQTLPPTFLPTEEGFSPINKLDKDLKVLVTYTESDNSRTIALLNLKNNNILKEWNIENPFDEVARIVNPIYCQDGSLIYNFYYRSNPGLTKLDPEGNKTWQNNKYIVHHGMNLDQEENIWACTQLYSTKGAYGLNGQKVFFNDHNITQYDGKTGDILFEKSIMKILVENDLANYILKAAESHEPIHLNDVQPALKTTKYYQKGDLFISLRNISTVLHYRPSTNELINLMEGPFIHQHDVDFLNDSVLVIYNNNTYKTWEGMQARSSKSIQDKSKIIDLGIFRNNIVSYNFSRKEYGFIGLEVFNKNKIETVNEGLMEFINENTYFVEEQNPGVLWVIKNDEVIYKNVLKSHYEGYHHLPNWTRIIID